MDIFLEESSVVSSMDDKMVKKKKNGSMINLKQNKNLNDRS